MNSTETPTNQDADAEIDIFSQKLARQILISRDSEKTVTLRESELSLLIAESIRAYHRF